MEKKIEMKMKMKMEMKMKMRIAYFVMAVLGHHTRV